MTKNPRRFAARLSILALLSGLVPSARADGGGTKLIQAAADPLGLGLLPVVGMHDMEGRRWGFAVSPFVWKTTHIGTDGGCCGAVNDTLPDLSGEGGALAVSVELTPHWGVEVFGAKAFGRTVDLQGDISGLAPLTANAGTPGGAGLPGGAFSNYTAATYGGMVTWDHFANPDGFRMPISVGVFEGSQTLDFDHTYVNGGVSQTETVRVRRNYPGVVANVSFDFLFFKQLRVMPGILVGQGFAGQEFNIDYSVQRNGVTKVYPNSITGTPGFGTVYTSIAYRPWGVSYTVSIIPDFATTHALTFSHKFSFDHAST